MKPSHSSIIQALKDGGILWRYSSERSGRLFSHSTGNWTRVHSKTIQDMETLLLIREDQKRSVYRDFGGSDIHYQLT